LNLGLNEVTRLLNQSYPQLEESSDLFLRTENSLNTLEKLQVRKIEPELNIIKAPASIFRRLKISVLIFFISLIISLILNRFDLINRNKIDEIAAKSSNLPGLKESILRRHIPEKHPELKINFLQGWKKAPFLAGKLRPTSRLKDWNSSSMISKA
jgi:hypothetical protein